MGDEKLTQRQILEKYYVKKEIKDKVLNIRVTQAQYDEMNQLAAKAEMTMTQYILESCKIKSVGFIYSRRK